MFHFVSDYRWKKSLLQLTSKNLVLLEAAFLSFLFLVSLKAHNLLPKTLDKTCLGVDHSLHFGKVHIYYAIAP